MSSTNDTEFTQTLTRQRARLRNLHQATHPPHKITYRGHHIRRENGDQSQSGTYRIMHDGEFIDAVEPSDFHNSDDWVRYVDLVIQQGSEEAKDWLRNELAWGWSEDDQEAEA